MGQGINPTYLGENDLLTWLMMDIPHRVCSPSQKGAASFKKRQHNLRINKVNHPDHNQPHTHTSKYIRSLGVVLTYLIWSQPYIKLAGSLLSLSPIL